MLVVCGDLGCDGRVLDRQIINVIFCLDPGGWTLDPGPRWE